MHKYGKSLGDVAWFHDDFVSREAELLSRQLAVENLYVAGPPRESCILCQAWLKDGVRFRRGPVEYAVCPICGHVNGLWEVTERFTEFAYGSEVDSDFQGAESPYTGEFTTGKMSDDYDQVVSRIYAPKARFLKEALQEQDASNILDLEILDFGCGGGHFLNALGQEGFKCLHGVDSFPSAIREAEAHGLRERVKLIDVGDVNNFLTESNFDVVCMMCVLPHLQDPVRVLRVMQEQGVRWTYQKIPMWSLATLLESTLPQLHSRVLAMDHTNVFTWKSLEWLEAELGMSRVASWSFGADVLDLIRKLQLSLRHVGCSDFVGWALSDLNGSRDELQLTLDRNGLCSEIHLLWDLQSRGHAH